MSDLRISGFSRQKENEDLSAEIAGPFFSPRFQTLYYMIQLCIKESQATPLSGTDAETPGAGETGLFKSTRSTPNRLSAMSGGNNARRESYPDSDDTTDPFRRMSEKYSAKHRNNISPNVGKMLQEKNCGRYSETESGWKIAVLIEGTKWCSKSTTADRVAANVLYMDDTGSHKVAGMVETNGFVFFSNV